MNELSDSTTAGSISRSIKRLTVAVWILAALIAFNTFVSLLALVAPSLRSTRAVNAIAESSAFSQTGTYNGFRDWSIDKQIQSASVIAIAKWQQTDGTLKCVISEILKQAPNTTFHYKVGDEYHSANQTIRDNTIYGDGQIMFFTGSPAEFRRSVNYSNDRIRGLGDMPISDLRMAVQKQK